MSRYVLKHPIKDENGVELTWLEVRRMKMKDIRALEKEKGGGVDQQAFLISRLTGLISPIVDDLDIEDVFGLSALIEEQAENFQLPGHIGTPRL